MFLAFKVNFTDASISNIHTCVKVYTIWQHGTLLKIDVLNNTSGCVTLHDLRAAVTH